MALAAELPAATPRAELLDRLRERLEQAELLTGEMQQGLQRADSHTIEAASARLDTLALEFKLLHAEYSRLPKVDETTTEPGLATARAGLDRTATRLARSAAIGGGLLERLVALTSKLIGTLQTAGGETYLASGKTRELPFEGLRLREKA